MRVATAVYPFRYLGGFQPGIHVGPKELKDLLIRVGPVLNCKRMFVHRSLTACHPARAHGGSAVDQHEARSN